MQEIVDLNHLMVGLAPLWLVAVWALVATICTSWMVEMFRDLYTHRYYDPCPEAMRIRYGERILHLELGGESKQWQEWLRRIKFRTFLRSMVVSSAVGALVAFLVFTSPTFASTASATPDTLRTALQLQLCNGGVATSSIDHLPADGETFTVQCSDAPHQAIRLRRDGHLIVYVPVPSQDTTAV